MDQLQADALAYQIASRLEDLRALPLYKSYVERYPAYFLKETLEKVMSMDRNKIRSSRAALYVYLVQQYDPNLHRHQP